jgi:hypothetical protein
MLTNRVTGCVPIPSRFAADVFAADVFAGIADTS